MFVLSSDVLGCILCFMAMWGMFGNDTLTNLRIPQTERNYLAEQLLASQEGLN
jgi:hypothetical protein